MGKFLFGLFIAVVVILACAVTSFLANMFLGNLSVVVSFMAGMIYGSLGILYYINRHW